MGSSGRTAVGALSTSLVRTERAIANNCWGMPQNTLISTAGTHKTRHTILANSSDICVEYSGHYSAGGGTDQVQPVSIPLKASLLVGGVVYPLTFNGLRSVTLDPGGYLRSDPITLDIDAATRLDVLTFANTTGFYGNTTTKGGWAAGGFVATDQTDVGTGVVADSTSTVFGPCNISGTRLAVGADCVIAGDSISAGEQDVGAGGTGVAYAAWSTGGGVAGGFMARALTTAKIGHVNIAQSGSTALQFAGAVQGKYRKRFIRGRANFTSNFGVNDLSAGQTTAQLQANLVKIWTNAASRGPRVFQTTITPVTTSTDGWVTTGNQTIANAGNNTNRIAVNDWLRAGAPIDPVSKAAVAVGTAGALVAGSGDHPLYFVFDIADAVETARNSGIWKANYTPDGTHPSATGAAAAAGAVDTTKLLTF